MSALGWLGSQSSTIPPTPPPLRCRDPSKMRGGLCRFQYRRPSCAALMRLSQRYKVAAQHRDSGIIVIPDSFAVVHSDLILRLVGHHRLPAIYPFALMSTRPSTGKSFGEAREVAKRN